MPTPRFLVRSVLDFWSSAGRRRLEPLAAVGRMPLTTYLTQCIVLTVLFYGYGFGWYRRFGLTEMFVITFMLFLPQMAFSLYGLPDG
jgi:uncharacterized protein